MDEMELLRAQLKECERDLWRYQAQKNSDHPALAANYRHKEAQVEALRARLAALENGEGAQT